MKFGGWWLVPVLVMFLFKEQSGRIIESIPNPVWIIYAMAGLMILDVGTQIFSLFVDYMRLKR
jgi:hypothetical protein